MRPRRTPLRAGVLTGLAAALAAWAVFGAAGGSLGMHRLGAPVAIAIFVLEIVLYAYAGLSLGRHGHGSGAGAFAGLVAGLVAGLAADLPRTALLLLSRPHMRWLQHAAVADVHLPWPGLALVAALLGASLAGAALGAACGSIGSTIAGPRQFQLP